MNPKRGYCKKGCTSDDENMDDCYSQSCSKLCIKSKIGEDEEKASGI
jgi:hypothetical protein